MALTLQTLCVLIITRKILAYACYFGSICFAQYLNRKSGVMSYSSALFTGYCDQMFIGETSYLGDNRNHIEWLSQILRIQETVGIKRVVITDPSYSGDNQNQSSGYHRYFVFRRQSELNEWLSQILLILEITRISRVVITDTSYSGDSRN